MNEITDVREVRNVEDLIAYFATKLGWNVDLDSFESIDDFSYGFTAEDLGLNADSFAKIRSLRQLRPFDEQQKWGLFCVEFDSGKFEVSALRKVLSGLIPRRRNVDRANVWNQNDILFLCDWGETANRAIGIAHFEEREKGLAQIKMIYCEPSSVTADEHGDIRTFETRIAKLAWPEDPSEARNWSRAWSAAFTTAYRETIRKAAELTQELAKVAKSIRDGVLKTMAVENSRGSVHRLWEKFKHSLIADMSEEDFADMYAQTIVYGLFSARCMDKTPGDFSVEEAIDCIPSTNPFLKNLMAASVGVQGLQDRLDFDELEIDNVVDLLLHTDMTEIVEDFNRQAGGGKEDPVIYFYEGFAKAYDKEKRVACGEFYTPVPVVNFIVRAVDDILKRDFGYADGLATTAKKKVKYVRESKHLVNGSRTQVDDEKEVPAVQILDVATGTGTFIRQTILRVYENFRAKHAGTPEDALKLAWNVYVNKNLLPRLNGFEINMAPYAVAHMKLAMALKDTGYEFLETERLRVYLTNSLEEAGSDAHQGMLWEDPLATESVYANGAKKNANINVVIGNPPYSGVSMNNGAWITKLVDEYKYTDGVYFNERKHWLNDDYVKFIRYGQERVRQAGSGILAYINPHGFIDNVTFRAMRWNLLKEFDEIYILNLHGNAKKHEICPDGSKDENVFEIQQGVSINIFVKHGGGGAKKPLAKVYYADVYGKKEEKFDFLGQTAFDRIDWIEANPIKPYYIFARKDLCPCGYETGFRLDELFGLANTGVVTARDGLVVDMDRNRLLERMNLFSDTTRTDAQIRALFYPSKKDGKYLAGDTRGWKLSEARKNVSGQDIGELIRHYDYRPFDSRYIYYSSSMVDWGREQLMQHLSCGGNVAMLCCRQIVGDAWSHISATTMTVDDCRVSNRTKERGYVFPLYLYDSAVEPPTRRVNFDEAIYRKICAAAGVPFDPNDLQAHAASDETPQMPQRVFDYIYGVLHSGKFRKKYAEFLKIDFPRIPYPKGGEEFGRMAAFGARLRRIHCMEDFAEAEDVVFVPDGGTEVTKVTWADDAVFINGKTCFTNVAKEHWDFFIGGYQPLQKWLKDRKGAQLSSTDVSHYRRIVQAIRSTRDIMSEIDKI